MISRRVAIVLRDVVEDGIVVNLKQQRYQPNLSIRQSYQALPSDAMLHLVI